VQLKEIPDSFAENVFASCIVPYGKYAWENLIDNTVNNYEVQWYDTKEGGEPAYFPHAVDMSQAGEYSKYVVAIGDGCPSLRSEMKVIIHPSPKIDRAQVGVGSVQISLSDGLAPYTYDFEGTRIDMEPEENTFELTGLLPLGKHNFLIIDANGCPTEGTFLVNKALLEPAPYFSPNEKEHSVPLWTIKNLDLYLDASISIEIFDRSGKRLYYANAKDFRGWDGTFNGQAMPSTDYWYSIYVQQTDERIVGNLTLKR
jgi:gliding motility-associated-like protein